MHSLLVVNVILPSKLVNNRVAPSVLVLGQLVLTTWSNLITALSVINWFHCFIMCEGCHSSVILFL